MGDGYDLAPFEVINVNTNVRSRMNVSPIISGFPFGDPPFRVNQVPRSAPRAAEKLQKTDSEPNVSTYCWYSKSSGNR